MASEAGSAASWSGLGEDDDDTDMTYELASEESEMSTEDEETEEGTTTLYFDAETGHLYTESGTVVQTVDESNEEDTNDDEEEDEEDDDDDEEDDEEDETGAQTPRAETAQAQQSPQITITQRQILQLLRNAGLAGIFQPSRGGGITTRSQARRTAANDGEELDEEDEEDDDEEEESYWFGNRRPRRRAKTFVGERWPKVPSEEGTKLMASGTFGTSDRCDHSACGKPFDESTRHKRRRLSRRLLDRELGTGGYGRTKALSQLGAQDLIPSSKADMIINIDHRCYSGQFSDDGSFFFCAGQDFRVRMYDTSNPYDWRYYKTVHYYGGQWTITDASLSPDNKLLAYSSIRSTVCLAKTDPLDSSDPQMLNFGNSNSASRYDGGHFGIWSLRFSGDGSEIVAGTSNSSVYVYDLEAQRTILQIPAHQDDVNATCFGDKMSPHILYSGSDDTTLKIWDRRSLSSMRPAGMFLGHTEGLTFVDSKGDGRYVVSNAKDQTCKLWDLRRMITMDTAEKIDPQEYTTGFDYRYAYYPEDDHEPHPHDCSVVTFRGHKVLSTLIRCHFSPPLSTDQKYVYSGSSDGKIHVWNLDGTTKSIIDVFDATQGSRPAGTRGHSMYDWGRRTNQWKTIVRDCSWHPSAPVIAATSWNGPDQQLGTCTVHSWNDGADGDEIGEPDGAHIKRPLGATPMGARLTPQLLHDQRFYDAAEVRTRGIRNRLNLINDDDDE